MGVGHLRRDVVGVGDESAALVRKRMHCLSLAGIEDRERVAGDAYINSAADKCVGHGVMHAGDGDMEVGSDFGSFPFRALPTLCWRVSEQLCFKLFKQLPPTGGVSTKRGVRIDRVNSFEYATVKFIKADALVVVKSMDDLLGHDLDRCLDIGLVFRPFCPRRQRSGVVVLQKLLVRGVDTTIAIGGTYRVRRRRGVIRDDDLLPPRRSTQTPAYAHPATLVGVHRDTHKQTASRNTAAKRQTH